MWTLDKRVTENCGKQSLTDLIDLKIAGQIKGIMDKMATVNNGPCESDVRRLETHFLSYQTVNFKSEFC